MVYFRNPFLITYSLSSYKYKIVSIILPLFPFNLEYSYLLRIKLRPVIFSNNVYRLEILRPFIYLTFKIRYWY